MKDLLLIIAAMLGFTIVLIGLLAFPHISAVTIIGALIIAYVSGWKTIVEELS